MDLSDRKLLDRFANDRDDAAFRALVERHLPLVQGVARRVTGNDELARDVAQQAFMRLVRRAALIPHNLSLSAWLHRVTRHLAIDLVRSEERRKRREKNTPPPDAMDSPPPPDWSALAPVIDGLIDRLPAVDREVLLLRYYRDESHVAVARQLGLTEAAAKKRAVRALEKLRSLLRKRGIATTSAALATLLPAHAATPAAPSLVLAITSAANGIAPAAPTAFSSHLAMSVTQKSAVAASAVVFLASFGYAVRGRSPDQTAKSELPAIASSGRPVRPDTDSRPARPLPASAAERLERLREIFAKPAGASRTRELIGFIDSLAPAHFEDTAGHLRQLGVPLNGLDFNLMLAAWTKVKPREAAGWSLHDDGEAGIAAVILECWGESDPHAAIDWVLREFPDPTGVDPQQPYPLPLVLAGLAARDPAAAVEALDRISGEEERAHALLMIASRLSDKSSESLDRLLEATEPGIPRSRLIAWNAHRLVGEGRATTALELLSEDEAARSFLGYQDFFRVWHRSDSAGLDAAIPGLPAGEIQDQAVAAACLESVNANPPETFNFLHRYPGAATDLVIARMAEDCPIEHVALAAEEILKITDPVLRDESLTRRLGWWLERRPDEARTWIDGRELPAGVLEALEFRPAYE